MFELIGLALIAAAAWFVISMVRGGSQRFCTACGHVGKARIRTRGNVVVEIVLWLLFIVPGVIYTIWRHATRAEVCVSCGASSLIPPDSPMAKKLRRELGP